MRQGSADHPNRVGIAGFGAVGKALGERLAGGWCGYELTSVAAGRLDVARADVEARGWSAVVVPAEELVSHADTIIECAPASAFGAIAEPVVEAGKTLIVLSVGALLDHWHLVERAAATGATIALPTGALVGLDAVQGAAIGEIHSVHMVTRKPVAGLVNAPYLVENGIDLSDIDGRTQVFHGSVREAIVGFPANLNVAVGLALAGIGPDDTTIEVWADPDIDRNMHQISVDSDSVRLDLKIENIPSSNPRTGRLTAASVLALLKKQHAALKVGT